MLVDEIESREIADALVELRGILEIAEQERQAQDLEALADGERVGPVDIAKSLIGEETRCRENRLASLQQVVQRRVRHPHGNTGPSVRLSRARRSGPGRKVTVSTGTWTLLKITDRFWRSLVSSPL